MITNNGFLRVSAGGAVAAVFLRSLLSLLLVQTTTKGITMGVRCGRFSRGAPERLAWNDLPFEKSNFSPR